MAAITREVNTASADDRSVLRKLFSQSHRRSSASLRQVAIAQVMVMVLAKGYADDSRKVAGTELLSVPKLVALAGSLNGRGRPYSRLCLVVERQLMHRSSVA